MDVTQRSIQAFVGGQAEVQHKGLRVVLRGELESINIVDAELRIRFVWLAKREGNQWTRDPLENLDYVVQGVKFTNVREINDGRLFLYGKKSEAAVSVFLPTASNRLDPRTVHGLEMAEVT